MGTAEKSQTSLGKKDQERKPNSYDHVQDDAEPIRAGMSFTFNNHVVTRPADYYKACKQFEADNEYRENGKADRQH